MVEEAIRPSCGENTVQVISSIIFLRFLGPCVTFPEKYGLIDREDEAGLSRAKPYLITLSKLMLSVANGGVYSQDNARFEKFNEFAARNHQRVIEWTKELLVRITPMHGIFLVRVFLSFSPSPKHYITHLGPQDDYIFPSSI